MDEDEAELYQRRLKRTLADLKVRDLSTFQVQGRRDGQEIVIYVQVVENRGIDKEWKSQCLKEGVVTQREETKKGTQTGHAGRVNEKGEVMLSDDEVEEEIIGAGQKRKPETQLESEAEKKRQKIE